MTHAPQDNRRALQLHVVDKNGKHLPGVVLDYTFGKSHAEIRVEDNDPLILIPNDIEEVTFLARYPGAKTVHRVARSTDGQSRIEFPDVTAREPLPNWQVLLALVVGGLVLVAIVSIAFVNTTVSVYAFGIVFVATLLVLAFLFPNPTDHQYLVIRVILAMACAGVATMLTGFIDVQISNAVTAGGALAVFAVVYFWSPAALVRRPQ